MIVLHPPLQPDQPAFVQWRCDVCQAPLGTEGRSVGARLESGEATLLDACSAAHVAVIRAVHPEDADLPTFRPAQLLAMLALQVGALDEVIELADGLVLAERIDETRMPTTSKRRNVGGGK